MKILKSKLLPVIHSTSWESLELLVEDIYNMGYLSEVAKGNPVDIVAFFEFDLPEFMAEHRSIEGFQTGIRDLIQLLNRPNIEGYTNAQEKYSYLDEALYNDESISGQRRLRSTAGHEVYHCIEHIPRVRDFISMNSNEAMQSYYRESGSIPPYQHPEIQADVFSGCLLMPRFILRQLDKEGKLAVDYLVERFNVNPAFVRSRLKRKTIKS